MEHISRKIDCATAIIISPLMFLSIDPHTLSAEPSTEAQRLHRSWLTLISP